MSAQLEIISESPIDLQLTQQTLNLTRRRQTWARVRDLYDPIFNALLKMDIEPRLDSEEYFTVMFAGDGDKLTRVVRVLRQGGFEFPKDSRPKPGDTQWYQFFTHPACKMNIFLHFTSSVCKRVKVGTKMVEQDIYETHCGNDLGEVEFEVPALEMQL